MEVQISLMVFVGSNSEANVGSLEIDDVHPVITMRPQGQSIQNINLKNRFLLFFALVNLKMRIEMLTCTRV